MSFCHFFHLDKTQASVSEQNHVTTTTTDLHHDFYALFYTFLYIIGQTKLTNYSDSCPVQLEGRMSWVGQTRTCWCYRTTSRLHHPVPCTEETKDILTCAVISES